MSSSGYVSLPIQSDAQSQAPERTDQDLNDYVDLVEKRPGWFAVIVCAQNTYWNIILILFLMGLDTVLKQFDINVLPTELEDVVSCQHGVPKSWKVLFVILLIGFSCLELHFALKTKMGQDLMEKSKSTIAIALLLGFFDRYDSFGDICFGLIANACGSVLGLYSIVLFGLGVVLAQSIPAYYLLFTQKNTHLALRFNAMVLFLEIIDPGREGIQLPDKMKAAAVGNIEGNFVKKRELTPADSEFKSALPSFSAEEIAKIKEQIELLTEEEAMQEMDNPEDVKRAAIVAQSKKVMGAVKFFCEDLLQSSIQTFFLVTFWAQLSFSDKAFFISSIAAGVIVSLAGPVHAMYKEAVSKAYYASLPKMQDNLKFEGLQKESGTFHGFEFAQWNQLSLSFDLVQGDVAGELKVIGKLNRSTYYKENLGNPDEPNAEPILALQSWLTESATAEEELHGTFDPSKGMLSLKAVEITPFGPGAENYHWLDYKLKVYPNKLKGIASQQPEKLGVVVFSYGEIIEQDSSVSELAPAPLTLKRVL
mmetsp:Transcript_111993/g.210046  ORF Transcript_111993/g.210046 Transcript_111993/m.210046 type:complete len:535 (-) Transcript_111993:99-1703(-)